MPLSKKVWEKKKNPLRKYKGKAQYNGFKNSTLPIGVNMMNYMG
jgi:hypothetical protein